MNQILKITLGTPEEITPAKMFSGQLKGAAVSASPENIKFETSARGCRIELPLEVTEQIYGFGLQMQSFNQLYKKKVMRVNSDPVPDTGDSHAPVPMYVSNKGYAVLVDTARYAAFYIASHRHLSAGGGTDKAHGAADNTADLYAAREGGDGRVITVEVPVAQGADIYIFKADSMLEAVSLYNRFSGGGYLPPAWGLGIWYRTCVNSDEKAVAEQSARIREENIPCDVYGLEPYWQSHAYSCTYVWNNEKFPEPKKMIDGLSGSGYHVNLWEHAFIDKGSPIYNDMTPYAGDFEVWSGLVPDFSIEKAREIFAEYHRKHLVELGVSGFKLDECDNSDFISSPWSFPECSKFPGGADGEQMHSLFGMLYQKAILQAFEGTGKRTLQAVRNTHAFAAPLPFVLYSDLYEHKEFIRSMVNASFTGLSWTPEVRQCNSVEDLYRRVQSVIFSPMALINAWMIPYEPWKQFDEILNKEGKFLENADEVTAEIKKLFRLRTSLVPYLYEAYRRYETEGTPPFRALVLDYPDDPNTFACDLEYMMGDSLLIAPLVEGETSREVYLPGGEWHCMHTGRTFEGGQNHLIEADITFIPVFVKDNSIIAFCEPYEYFDGAPLKITPQKFGDGKAVCRLFEDDGCGFSYKNGNFNDITVTWDSGEISPKIRREGGYKGEMYIF